MIEPVGVFEKKLYRRDVISLARSPRAEGLGLFNGSRCLLQLCRVRRRPDGVIVAHRDAPVTHAASRVGDGNSGERLLGLFILEGMEPRDCPIELPLGLWGTGDGEVDP